MSTFIFDKHELTPNLKEYSAAIEIYLGTKFVKPPIDMEPISFLSQFLRIKDEEVRKVVKANCNACLFSFLAEIFRSIFNVLKGKDIPLNIIRIHNIFSS